ncbi:MAG: hypothetical protein ACR2MX_09265 [Cyclobacteriaceae bacterium]
MRILIFISFIALVQPVVKGQPDFSAAQWVEDIKVFADANDPSIFYYGPGKMQLIKDQIGKPDFKFLQMRYTGTRTYADQGFKKFNSLIRFKVGIEQHSSDHISRIKQHLSVGLPTAILKPLPLYRIQAILVYATIPDAGKNTDSTEILSGGFFGSVEEESQGLWKQRLFTIRLDPNEAQLFWQAFYNQQSVLSVGYSYYGYGVDNASEEVQLQGDSDWLDQLETNFPGSLDSLKADTQVAPRKFFTDAFSIQVDCRQYPDLMQQVDINEQVPPDYAALDVYCYDFNNEVRQDLHAKKVELKAIGVGRDAVVSKVTFRATTPDIYAHNVRFKHSVRLDRPLSYRITEITKEGEIRVSQWQVQKTWHEILDVTTQHTSTVN